MSTLRTLLRRLRRPRPEFSRTSYAQEGEDMVLQRFFENRQPGFYVDVGAHHPQRFSNTYYFYRLGWRGINIDPSPDAIALFEKERPRDINVCVGVAETAGELTYHMFDEPALNTFDGALRRDREVNTSYRVIGSITVAVSRLDDVFRQKLPAGQAIAFLTIDAEGLDFEVVRSNDWAMYRPEMVLVEALDARLDRLVQHPLHSYMVGVGYLPVAKTLNTLFYRDAR